jgi:tetratricopeptide (TPR) repeat protein
LAQVDREAKEETVLKRRRLVVFGLLVAVVAGVLGVAVPRLRRGGGEESPAERHYRNGLEMAQAGNGARAVTEWQLAIAMNPADARPYDALVEYWEAAGQPDRAVATLDRLARANPLAPHQDCRLARAAFAAGWITRAAEAADRAIRTEPGCPLGHTLRGIVLDDAGETAEALAELTKAHQLNPENERIALTLAQMEGRSGRRANAMARVREVLQRDPRSPQAHYLMGWLLARTTPHTPAADREAIQHLQQMLAQNPEHGGSLAELGDIYRRQGQAARARPLLEKARTQDASNPSLVRSLALTYRSVGDPRAASLSALASRLEARQQRRRDLRRRHRLNPADAGLTLQLARLERDAGQPREALDLVQQVLHADPNNRTALDLLHEVSEGPPAASSPPPGG